MADAREQSGRSGQVGAGAEGSAGGERGPGAPGILRSQAGEDARKPYEPPRITKRRSVAHATLYTAMGPGGMSLTMSG
jgi:hypothetical protein